MKMKDYLFTISILIFSLLCCSRIATADSFPPLPEALAALESDEDVTVSEVVVEEWEEGSNFYFSFLPHEENPTIGFIIYPGALIDPRSYAPAAHEIAAQGYLTVIVKMVNDLALGVSVPRAGRVIDDFPEIDKWVIGGHSLGGVGASAYTQKYPQKIDGVVLWASFPSETFRIDDKDVAALSMYGLNDGLVTLDEIEASREQLPPATQFVPIEGGNHTQFGWYDTSPDPVQPEDNPADITREEQQEQIIQATVAFLEQFTVLPPTAAIPTLSDWGIIIFMTIIIGLGVITLLRRRMV
jgi:hypothetical protein